MIYLVKELDNCPTLLDCFSMKMYSNRRKEKLNLIKKELKSNL